MLAALPGTAQRRAWDAWCTDRGLAVRVVAQVQDSALMKTMGQAGLGLFAAPDAIAASIGRTFGLRRIGVIPELRQRFYGISPDRRLANPALQAITARGRDLFA